PWAAHFAWNATEDAGLGLVPNPGNGPLGSLFDFDLVGSALWGGGPEGLNASIGTAAALVALIVPLLLIRPVPGSADGAG
ncbi:MAG TPA: CPBP family intramembrane metalloprotease, partial [Novosphingobium sp.]|nr:CPBP family intramembrane metalloprotease [Novosphingobium sp.]